MHTLHASKIRYACIHESKSASRFVGATPYTETKVPVDVNDNTEEEVEKDYNVNEDGNGNFQVALNSNVLWCEMLLYSISSITNL